MGLPVPDVEDLIDPIDLSDLFVSRENMTEHLLVLEQLREVNPTWYQVIVFSTVYDLDNNTIGELLGQKPELISKWKSRGRAVEEHGCESGTRNSTQMDNIKRKLP